MQHVQSLNDYLQTLNRRYAQGNAGEHTYRKDLEDLLLELLPEIEVTNEPSKVTDCGNPDYLLSKQSIPVGFIEAKDIGKDLNHKQYKEQFNRYRSALDNLIITDYLWFQFFKNGELVEEIRLADCDGSAIVPRPEDFARFALLLADFVSFIGQTITAPGKLATMMAGKARLLENTLENALIADMDNDTDSELRGQYEAFQRILIHDLTPHGFADIYAQTLAYGMFAARLHDDTLDTFSRQEAAERIPKSNPFLRRLFDYVAGANIDERIKMTVDNLAEVFRATDVAKLLTNFNHRRHDPIIHFYETFLGEYNPKLRKQRGVWYTPEAVVNFIVRTVDDVLKSDFALPDGLASTEKTTIKLDTQTRDARTASGYKQIEKSVHKVQILDPATGTGTFLAAIIRHLYDSRFAAMGGLWNSYVDEHLIPRLNGFELLMAPYAMAHLKLDLLLKETGYQRDKDNDQRFNIFLTNSLEPHHPDTGTLFANWLSQEANAANRIKRDAPVMVVLGNPPYSGESANKGEWIMQLMDDYKKEPSGVDKLNERNPKWINDDYVKFMRYGQQYIEANGEGILAFINPHGFLDNPTFRGMRWQLLNTYDSLYIIDLHGNSKKKETVPDGSKDDNVFDIQQGVSINILVKTGKKKKGELGKVYHVDCYGKRQQKYDWLNANRLASIDFSELPHNEPMHFMVQKDFQLEAEYKKGFAVNEMFPLNSVGIVTARDAFTIHDSKADVNKTIETFLSMEDETARTHFKLGKDVRDWKVSYAKADLQKNYPDDKKIVPIAYRPFDTRFTFYTGQSKGFHCYPRSEVMQHFQLGDNVGLIIGRQGQVVGSMQWNLSFIANQAVDFNMYYRGGGLVFPLYLYTQNLDGSVQRGVNLDRDLLQQFADSVGLVFIPSPLTPLPEGEGDKPTNDLSLMQNKLPGREGDKPTNNLSPMRDKLPEGEGDKPTNDLSPMQNKLPLPQGEGWGEGEMAGKTSHLTTELNATFTPENLLDYIYAVLHSPNYREKYAEFLKIDFPRVPFPDSAEHFWQLTELGEQLRLWHLLKHPDLSDFSQFVTTYPIAGDNDITRKMTKTSIGYEATGDTHGKVWINDTQYFDNVPKTAWEFYIGGYQPAQKWLKDRHGRTLSYDDIVHYQRIILAQQRTHNLMQTIDQMTI